MFHILLRLIRQHQRVTVRPDLSVTQIHNPGGILPGQLRVVGHHHHQPVPGHFFQQFHHLDTGTAVQSSGGLVRQHDIRVIHQRPGNGHPLHLAAGHLIGLFVQLISQPHLCKRRNGPLPPLAFSDAGNGQRQFHVGQHRLMGDQVIALKHKADGMIPVGIPVPVPVLFCGNSIDNQFSAVIPVQTSDNIQQCGFSRTAGPQDRHKFVVTQIQIHMIQRFLHQTAGPVLLAKLPDLKHRFTSPFLSPPVFRYETSSCFSFFRDSSSFRFHCPFSSS